MTQYGSNFIVYVPYMPERKSARYDIKNLSKSQVIEAYKDWYANKIQTKRLNIDMQELNALDEGNYSVTTRQRTGHRYTGKLQSGIEMFESRAIQW